ncbi:unnamed protein product [Lupinus luteus]|uniref:Uncharacterized protein n=1 Tax=Lupinus luteus TaxID=3873 RepID=A0AAV1W834_LUPLU
MKGSSCLANINSIYSSLHFENENYHVIQCQRQFSCTVKVAKVRNLGFKMNNYSWPNHASCLVKQGNDDDKFVMRCANWSLEAEMNTEEGEYKESVGTARFKEKCVEEKGVVEMLECLEREAIMGEDVGKEPKDYNRRAQIFDKSSKVFLALKEHNSDAASQR